MTLHICTSRTRPTAPAKDQEIYETDTKRGYVYDGSAWRPSEKG